MTPRGAASPTPWRASEGQVPGYAREISIVCGDVNTVNFGICKMDGAGSFNLEALAEVRANAALIVQAVNERAGLIAALRDLRECLTQFADAYDLEACGVDIQERDRLVSNARRVLAQSDEPNKEGAKP